MAFQLHAIQILAQQIRILISYIQIYLHLLPVFYPSIKFILSYIHTFLFWYTHPHIFITTLFCEFFFWLSYIWYWSSIFGEELPTFMNCKTNTKNSLFIEVSTNLILLTSNEVSILNRYQINLRNEAKFVLLLYYTSKSLKIYKECWDMINYISHNLMYNYNIYYILQILFTQLD